MRPVKTIGLDIAKSVFKCMAWMLIASRQIRRCGAQAALRAPVACH